MARLSSRAFTLIELLIVVAIIGVLMAILVPATGSVIESARRAQAKNDVVQIATALVGYETEYGHFPPSLGKGVFAVDRTLIDTLTGKSSDANPKAITFLEVSGYKRGKSGTNETGDFVDPWALTDGKKATVYYCAIDTGFDNKTIGGTDSQIVNKKVAVWNDPKLSTSDKAKQQRRAVTSWE
jgi:prepilin-type N-terminal cleavage/methylation domain-containing protein